jgi:oligo-1,6-glucosidase
MEEYDAFTVGETVFVDTKEANLLTAPEREELNMVFGFEHMEIDQIIVKWFHTRFHWDKFMQVLDRWQKEVGWNTLYLENHDHPRIISRYGSEAYRVESGKMLAAMYMLQRGTPFIYQGQEIGMTNIRMKSLDQFQDVMTHNSIRLVQGLLPQTTILKLVNKGSRENSRTPVQWNAEKNAGFTEGEPWFPVNENYREVNVAAQENDPNSLLNFYRKLIAFRKANKVALYGDYIEHDKKSKDFYVYERNYLDKKLLVICFFSKEQKRFDAPVGISLENGHLIFSNYEMNQVVSNGFTARPYELRVYLFDPERPKDPYEGLRKQT